MSVFDWIERCPWWVKAPFGAAGFFMSAFASRLPEEWQDIGLWFGIGLLVVAILAVFLHTIRDRWRRLKADAAAVIQGAPEENPAHLPRLSGRIEQIIVGDIVGDPEGDKNTNCYVQMAIRNTGAPSILDRWSATVTRQGQEYLCRLNALEDGSATLDFDEGKSRHLTRTDEIHEITATNPVATGQQVRGWIWLTVQGLPRDDFTKPGTLVQVTFEDVFARHCVAEYRFGTGKAERRALYFPEGTGSRQK